MQRLSSSSDHQEAPSHFFGSAATRTASAAQSQSWANLPAYESSASIREYTVNIIDKAVFVPTANKEKGTRPGAIGYLKPNKDVHFMLKVEDFHYASSITTNPTESVALESLCSQLIRFIFGNHYAADIKLIERAAPPDDTGNSHPCVQCNYAVLSRWESNCSAPTELSQPENIIATDMRSMAINATRIQTIAKLINMDDFKIDNIVKRADNSLFLIDCSGLLNGFANKESLFQPDWKKSTINLGSLFMTDIAVETIHTYLTADVIKINLIIESYRPILSNASLLMLKANFEKTRQMCEAALHPSKSTITTQPASPATPRSSYPKLLGRAASSSTADINASVSSHRK